MNDAAARAAGLEILPRKDVASSFEALRKAREILNNQNIPRHGRWVLISELTWLRLRHPGLFNRKPKSKAVRRARGREIRKGHLEK